MKHSRITVAALSLAFAACGSATDDPVPGVDGGDDPTADGGDVNAPFVVSVTPPDGATGIEADAELVIEFSEPMDAESVASAWTSVELADVSLLWNPAGNTLTVVPNEPLPYAEGTGFAGNSVQALSFSYEIVASARDLSGNALDGPLAGSFSTRRRFTGDLVRIDPLTRTMQEGGTLFGATAVSLTTGDSSQNLQRKSFASFETPVLPAGAEIENATLIGFQSSTINTPYVLGDLMAIHMNSPVLDEDEYDSSLGTAGTFSNQMGSGQRTLDVTDEFADDFVNRAARGDRTQYRLEFPTATNSNNVADEARYSRNSFAMTVTYIVD